MCSVMSDFDYSDPAEFYMARRTSGGRYSTGYRRFETAAKAIRYAIEDIPVASLITSVLEVDEERYRHDDIRRLYDDQAFPLTRKPGPTDGTA